MYNFIENPVCGYENQNLSEIKVRDNNYLTVQEVKSLENVVDPCLIVVKPHATDNLDLVKTIESLISDNGLSILVDKNIRFTRQNVFDIYGDLCKVMSQGEDGVNFVENLVSSFVDTESKARIMVVYGTESYTKMKSIKKIVREIGSVDRFRNVLHSSDDMSSTLSAINTFVHK